MNHERWQRRQEVRPGYQRGKRTDAIAPVRHDAPSHDVIEKGTCAYCGIPGVKLVEAARAEDDGKDRGGIYHSFFDMAYAIRGNRPKICRMCFDMTEPLAASEHFQREQTRWEQNQKRIKRILREIDEL